MVRGKWFKEEEMVKNNEVDYTMMMLSLPLSWTVNE